MFIFMAYVFCSAAYVFYIVTKRDKKHVNFNAFVKTICISWIILPISAALWLFGFKVPNHMKPDFESVKKKAQEVAQNFTQPKVGMKFIALKNKPLGIPINKGGTIQIIKETGTPIVFAKALDGIIDPELEMKKDSKMNSFMVAICTDADSDFEAV